MPSIYQSLVAVEPFTLIATICNLFIQMLIVKHFFLDKVMGILDARRKAADEQIEAAQAAHAEADAIKSEYEQNMAKAKEQANGIVAAAQKTAAARSEEMIGEARAQAAQIKQKAEADIAQERKKAVNDLKNEIGGMAMEIAGKVVERELDEKDHKALIDEFIKNVGESA